MFEDLDRQALWDCPSLAKISVEPSTGQLGRFDSVVVLVREGFCDRDLQVSFVSDEERRALIELASDVEMKPKLGSWALTRVKADGVSSSSGGFRSLVLCGIGSNQKQWTPIEAFHIGQTIATLNVGATKKTSVVAIRVRVEDGLTGPVLRSLVEGLLVGGYKDTRFKSEEHGNHVAQFLIKPSTEVKIVVEGTADSLPSRADLAAVETVISGMILTKQLINAPANVTTPAELAAVAATLARMFPESLSLKVLEEADCKRLRMNAFLAVGQGSSLPSKFIHLTYRAEGAIKKKLALVGKAITFDSGGINLKTGPGCMLELMKFDMGGAATILGVAKTIAQLRTPGVELHFIAAACENMCSGSSYRPGDVVQCSNGKTIEIGNTDAEGRVTLSDALVYAESLGVDAIVDIATLTGAAIVALGHDYAPFWTPDSDLAMQIESAARVAGENIWRMPLIESHRELIQSDIADIKNHGSRAGGSVNAALFLQSFIKNTPWSHIDIAGTGWNEKRGGATGYGVRLLVQWILGLSEAKAEV
mmetsp:Transcript_14913/g.30337  ORF Transcript_14913/g.30337 Transcript_14913/m.30337 type:complete len:534 (-) Transcript_14913:516-2117(-)